MSGSKTVLCILAVSLVLTGCVSSKEHKAKLSQLEAARNDNDKLKGELSLLNQHYKELETSRDRLQADNEILAARLENSNSTIASLETTNADLNAEKQKILEEKSQAVSKLKTTYDELVSEMHNEIQDGKIQITQLKDKLSLRMVDKILFDSGRSTVNPEGKKVLDRVAEILKTVEDKHIRIEGHTDNVPIGSRLRERFPTNWELSSMRATNVVRYIVENGGVNPDVMSVAGYSEHRPVASNDTDEGKAKNRRIEITLLPLELNRVPTEE